MNKMYISISQLHKSGQINYRASYGSTPHRSMCKDAGDEWDIHTNWRFVVAGRLHSYPQWKLYGHDCQCRTTPKYATGQNGTFAQQNDIIQQGFCATMPRRICTKHRLWHARHKLRSAYHTSCESKSNIGTSSVTCLEQTLNTLIKRSIQVKGTPALS